MKIEYDGFVLEIEEITDYDTGKRTHYRIICDQLPYFPQGLYKSDLETLITRFKSAVKSQMKTNEVERIKKEIVDKDAVLVYKFIQELNRVAKEMENIENNDCTTLVLDIKLKKIAKQFKDYLPFSDDLDSYRSYFNYVKEKSK